MPTEGREEGKGEIEDRFERCDILVSIGPGVLWYLWLLPSLLFITSSKGLDLVGRSRECLVYVGDGRSPVRPPGAAQIPDIF